MIPTNRINSMQYHLGRNYRFLPTMEMRIPRTHGHRFGGRAPRVDNEPFTPNVIERDEDEAHILQLQLSDFNEKDFKVKVKEEERTVVVTGNRLVADNRLLLLDFTNSIPQNCLIHKILHKFEAGFLTISMPKQTSAPAAEAETAAPPSLKPEQTTPEQGSEKLSPENETPPLKKPELTTPGMGSGEISPENKTPPPEKTEQQTPANGSEEISPGNKNSAPEETEQPTPEKGNEKISPQIKTPPPEKTVQPTPGKGNEEISPVSRTTTPEKTEQPTPEKWSEEISVENKTPPPEKTEQPTPEKGSDEISPETKTPPPEKTEQPTPEKGSEEFSLAYEILPETEIMRPKEIENQNSEKGKESKTGEMDKIKETAKIGTGILSPGATGVGKFPGGFKFRRMPLTVTAILAAAVVTAAAACLAFAYYGMSFAME